MNASRTIANRFVIADPERDLLGHGGMGDVFRAIDTQTGETVAVKALSPDVLARDPGLLERFLREGEVLRRLNHPNIVHMVAACEEAGRHYLVMEYVSGGSLEGLLQKRGGLPVVRTVEIGLDLADALTRAHRLGIIHRDLKPANVLLAPDGTPRLADFGIAHVANGLHLTQTGVLIGTVDYLSPEACQGEPLDERADIWAFGAMLYEMLSGHVPFAGQTLAARLTAILTQPVPHLAQAASGIPDALVDLVSRMLEKDRCRRIPSARLVGVELEALLSHDANEPGRSSPIVAGAQHAGFAPQGQRAVSISVPTSTFKACALPTDSIFQPLWEVHRRDLGCPIEMSYRVSTIAEETFQRGHVLWRKDTDDVYIVYDLDANGSKLNQGDWQLNPVEWKWDGSYPGGVGLQPPPGLIEPVRGFGWLWRTHLGGPHARLGWATDIEHGWDNLALVQQFEMGIMFKASAPRLYVLLDNYSFCACP